MILLSEVYIHSLRCDWDALRTRCSSRPVAPPLTLLILPASNWISTPGGTTGLRSARHSAEMFEVGPMVEVRLMQAAIAVAEELNFSRAAIRLSITQSALTKQIQDLEE